MEFSGKLSRGTITAIPNPKSLIKILEHPLPDVKYMFGIDSTMSTDNSSGNSGNSKFAMVGMKGVDPQSDLQFAPIVALKERPKEFDITFDTAIRILKYYNKYGNAKITGELNATGAVLCEKIQKTPGLKGTIMPRRDLKKSGWVDTSKPWFTRVDSIVDWQYLAANTYFKKYAHMVKFIDLLHDAQKGDDENKDLLDAFLACLYGWGTGDLLGEMPLEKKTYKMSIIVGRDPETMAPIWEERTYTR